MITPQLGPLGSFDSLIRHRILQVLLDYRRPLSLRELLFIGWPTELAQALGAEVACNAQRLCMEGYLASRAKPQTETRYTYTAKGCQAFRQERGLPCLIPNADPHRLFGRPNSPASRRRFDTLSALAEYGGEWVAGPILAIELGLLAHPDSYERVNRDLNWGLANEYVDRVRPVDFRPGQPTSWRINQMGVTALKLERDACVRDLKHLLSEL